MQLLTIRAAGFTATVDACAQDDGQIWFLSLLGNQQSVRALWARLVSRARPPGPRDHRRRAVRQPQGAGGAVNLSTQPARMTMGSEPDEEA